MVDCRFHKSWGCPCTWLYFGVTIGRRDDGAQRVFVYLGKIKTSFRYFNAT